MQTIDQAENSAEDNTGQACRCGNELVKSVSVIARTRTKTFLKAATMPAHVPLSGVTMAFDGGGKCVAGC